MKKVWVIIGNIFSTMFKAIGTLMNSLNSANSLSRKYQDTHEFKSKK